MNSLTAAMAAVASTPVCCPSKAARSSWACGNGLALSVFRADSRDEIMALGSTGGRARFGSADGIRRAGVELS